MRVKIYPSDRSGCGSYRLIWVAEALAAEGADVSEGEPLSIMCTETEGNPVPKVLGIAPPQADVVVFQRPVDTRLTQAIPLLQDAGIAVVLDIDDDLSCIHPANPAYAEYHPALNPVRNWRWVSAACRIADLVTVTTPALAARYASHGRVAILPNLIPERYLRLTRPTGSSELVTVGWSGWLDTHPTDLDVPRGAIGRVLTTTASRFLAIGDRRALPRLGVPETAPHRFTEWVAIEDYPSVMALLDVAVVPLADGRFNEAKCLDAGTRIATRRGVLRIADLDVGDQVWHDGRWTVVQATRKEVATAGVLLTTRSGRQLRLTREHRLWSNGWVEASTLVPGSLVALAPDEIGTLMAARAPWPSDGRTSRHHDPDLFCTASDVPTIQITSRWARFLGLFAGDGSTGRQGANRPTAVTISCDGQDQDLIDLICDDGRAMGFHPSTEHVTTWGGEVLRRRSVRFSSTHLLRCLAALGVVDSRKKVVMVPEVIWRSPKEVVAAYLAGVFEADGTVSNGSGVCITMKQRAFIQDIQRLLTTFGITSFIGERWNAAKRGGQKRQYWQLRLRRAGSDIFEKEIGFLSTRKQLRLAAHCAKPHSNAYMPVGWADEVITVEPCWLEPVDLQVAGGVFAAAGFLSHNSALKSLETAACGAVPLVSPTPDNARLIGLGIGLAATKPKEWERRLRRLVTEHGYRADLAGRAREAAALLTIEGGCGQWWDAWSGARRAEHSVAGG